MPKRILVTGKNGQLGRSLQKLAPNYPQFKFVFTDRNLLDLADDASIKSFFADEAASFSAIINTAAYTAVDKAETEPDVANRVNHLAVAQLADIAKAQRTFLLHVSTDYVFDGQTCRPYTEDDSAAPQSVYGQSKLKGEKAMVESGCGGAIIRTSWVYSEFGNNFVKTMLRLGETNEQLNVVFDQVGSPTYATDLATAILEVVIASLNQANPDVRIYNYSNDGVLSWYDFAITIFDLAQLPCIVQPIETKDFPTAAKRPHYSVLNKAKIKQDFDLNIPYWRDSLRQCLAALKKVQISNDDA